MAIKAGIRYSENLRSKKREPIGKILREVGYSKTVSEKPKIVTESKGFQSIVIPALARMEQARDKALNAINKKDMDGEKLPVLLTAVDVLTKNARLLGGQSTENVAISIEVSEHLLKKMEGRYAKPDNTKQ